MASTRCMRTVSSTAVSTSRTKVKIPRMIRAGNTAATTAARRCVAAAKNPKATRELDTQVRQTADRPTASPVVVLRADCSTKCSVTRADMNAWPGCGCSSIAAHSSPRPRDWCTLARLSPPGPAPGKPVIVKALASCPQQLIWPPYDAQQARLGRHADEVGHPEGGVEAQ